MYTSTLSLTSALDGVEGPRHSGSIKPPPPRGRPGIGCWVGPRDGLDKCGKSRLHQDRSSDPPAHSESLRRLSYPGPLISTFLNKFFFSFQCPTCPLRTSWPSLLGMAEV